MFNVVVFDFKMYNSGFRDRLKKNDFPIFSQEPPNHGAGANRLRGPCLVIIKIIFSTQWKFEILVKIGGQIPCPEKFFFLYWL